MCKKELNLIEMAVLNRLQGTQISNRLIKLNKVNQHDNNEIRRFQIPTVRGNG